MTLTQWFAEFRNPALKCARIGHKDRIETRAGYTWSKSSYYIADSVEQERHVCARCREGLTDWTDTHRTGLTGLTMDSDRMRILETEGALWS